MSQINKHVRPNGGDSLGVTSVHRRIIACDKHTSVELTYQAVLGKLILCCAVCTKPPKIEIDQ